MNDDLISRSTIKHAIYDVCLRNNNIDIFEKLLDRINELPSVNPQEPKTGHWIMDRQRETRQCDKCMTVYRWSFNPHNFCPACGIRMVESEDE